MSEPLVFPQEYLNHLRWKFILRIWYVYTFTGIWTMPSHPYLRTHRLCFSSTAPKGTIVAKHLPLHY